MAIEEGQALPAATLIGNGAEGPERIDISQHAKGRKLVIFGLPGAFTGTCTSAHVPSFIRTKAGFDEKGVDEIICVSVNDPFVMKAWGESTGATEAGLTFLADADGSFTKALGLAFDIPAVGLYGRSKRYAMVVEDGVVQTLHLEQSAGVCDASGGESLLATL